MNSLFLTLLLSVGLLLVALKFLVVSSSPLKGVLGSLMTSSGVFLCYTNYQGIVGIGMLLLVVIFTSIIGSICVVANGWREKVYQVNIVGKVEIFDPSRIRQNDRGIAITELMPTGKILVNQIIVEGQATDKFIGENTGIRVVKVINNKVIVEPLKEEL